MTISNLGAPTSARRSVAALAALLTLLPLNGVFHAVIAAGLFDAQLATLAPVIRPMHEAHPLPVVLLDGLLALLIVVFLARGPLVSRFEGAKVGALVNLASSAAWNLANAASFVSWSIVVTVVDVGWHVALGALAGAAAAMVLVKPAASAP